MEYLIIVLFVAFAAFVAVIPPGLVNIAVAKIALQKNKKNGIYAALGVIVVNFCHALIAVLAARYLDRHTNIEDYFLRIGVTVFAFLSVYFLFAAIFPNKTIQVKEVQKRDSHRSFIKGFLVGNLNILPILYFVFVSSQLKTYVSDIYDGINVYIFALSAALGTFSILYIYIIVFLKFERYQQQLLKNANFFMTIIMVILTITTWIRMKNLGG